jgi:hypothetical protein
MHKAIVSIRCPNIDWDTFDWSIVTEDVIILFADLIHLNQVCVLSRFCGPF